MPSATCLALIWTHRLPSAARLVGVLRCTQREGKGSKPIKNDRFLAVDEDASTYRDIRDIRDLNRPLLEQIEAFFVQYNALAGHVFTIDRR